MAVSGKPASLLGKLGMVDRREMKGAYLFCAFGSFAVKVRSEELGEELRIAAENRGRYLFILRFAQNFCREGPYFPLSKCRAS